MIIVALDLDRNLIRIESCVPYSSFFLLLFYVQLVIWENVLYFVIVFIISHLAILAMCSFKSRIKRKCLWFRSFFVFFLFCFLSFFFYLSFKMNLFASTSRIEWKQMHLNGILNTNLMACMLVLVHSVGLNFHKIKHGMNLRYPIQQLFHLVHGLAMNRLLILDVWMRFQLYFEILFVREGTKPTVWRLTSQC